MLIIILVFLGLSFLILAHEAAHFFAAKWSGLDVHEFGFGFPPRIFAKKIGNTEYSVNWILFGGFVRIAGERGEFAMVKEVASNEESYELRVRGNQEEKKNTGKERPRNSQLATGHLFYAQPAWKKSLIILAGVIMNFLLGWLLISGALAIGTPKAVVITDVEANSPASAAGIQSGDALEGYASAQSFIDYVNAHRGQSITFSVLRNAKDMTFTVTPRVATSPDEGAVGVGLADAGSPAEPVFPALRDGFLAAISMFIAVLTAFGGLIQQLFVHASLPQGVVGPVGIFGVAEETGKIGLIYLLQFVGIISINLTVVNLLPFPALDGGRFVMIIIEKIKGSAVPEKIEAWINGLGFAFLLILMLLLTVRDVMNIF